MPFCAWCPVSKFGEKFEESTTKYLYAIANVDHLLYVLSLPTNFPLGALHLDVGNYRQCLRLQDILLCLSPCPHIYSATHNPGHGICGSHILGHGARRRRLATIVSFLPANSLAMFMSDAVSNLMNTYTIVVALLAYFLLLSGFFIKYLYEVVIQYPRISMLYLYVWPTLQISFPPNQVFESQREDFLFTFGFFCLRF